MHLMARAKSLQQTPKLSVLSMPISPTPYGLEPDRTRLFVAFVFIFIHLVARVNNLQQRPKLSVLFVIILDTLRPRTWHVRHQELSYFLYLSLYTL